MKNLRVPRSLPDVWRELSAEEKALRIGQSLRLLWNLVKPVVGWTAFILAVGVYSVFAVIINALFKGK